ncbi:MAG: VWA domain-containing protein [Phycisphaeraceae bacterium]|nr:VWA domain-containing protein [Phycisphaeraceae bacterium]
MSRSESQQEAGRDPAPGGLMWPTAPLVETPEVPFEVRFIRFAKRATVVGVVVSLLVHVTAWLIAMHLRVEHDSRHGASGSASVVDFAVMTDVELAQLADEALSLESPVVPEVTLPDTATVDLLDAPPDIDLSGAMRELAETGTLTGAGDLGSGPGMGEGGGGAGGAGFFGAEATGSRFIYIVDVSGSMSFGGRIERLRDELSKSIDGLFENAHYSVITFSTGAQALGGEVRWLQANERNKRSTRRDIMGIQSGGGTNPAPGFDLAFRLRPRADAIFFMTDGEFPDQVAGEIERLNAEHRVPIHCICFMSREAEALMRRIARESGGTYTFVPGGGP